MACTTAHGKHHSNTYGYKLSSRGHQPDTPFAAHGLGIASCWIHRAKEEFERPEGRAILEGLGIDPDAYEGIGHCILGYADGPEPAAKPRKEGYVYRIA